MKSFLRSSVTFGFVIGLIVFGFSISSFADLGFVSQENLTQDEEIVEVAVGDSFHRNVIKAAVKARKSGKISRAQLLRLRVAMLSPAFRKQAKELATIQMKSSADADKIPMIGENIDWDKLFEFIEKLIPLIIQLIEIIAKVAAVDVMAPTLFYDPSYSLVA